MSKPVGAHNPRSHRNGLLMCVLPQRMVAHYSKY